MSTKLLALQTISLFLNIMPYSESAGEDDNCYFDGIKEEKHGNNIKKLLDQSLKQGIEKGN